MSFSEVFLYFVLHSQISERDQMKENCKHATSRNKQLEHELGLSHQANLELREKALNQKQQDTRFFEEQLHSVTVQAKKASLESEEAIKVLQNVCFMFALLHVTMKDLNVLFQENTVLKKENEKLRTELSTFVNQSPGKGSHATLSAYISSLCLLVVSSR